jgi:type II secretory pathway component GspD/PulD (secretin)
LPKTIAAAPPTQLQPLSSPVSSKTANSQIPQKDQTSSDANRSLAQNSASSSNQIAHSQFGGGVPDPARRVLPTTAGTVKIRKPFRLFAQEQLIHNLSFRDTPVREVIAEIARRGKLNILIDKSVVGKITGELRDVTLNEAMDSIMASAGLQNRILDNSTVIIGSPQAMMQLGLNRSMAKAFKLSYAHPYDVAMLLHASIFNKGVIPDFTKQVQTRTSSESDDRNGSSRERSAGTATGEGESTKSNTEENSRNIPDQQRIVRGASRSQTQEGTGFNDASTEPGQQRIRSNQEINTDYIVEQNGGGTIVIPDVKNRQVVIVGTPEDLAIAEESIRLIDRRPREVHIQASLVELTNQGIRQLGANLALQGNGLSNSLLGQSNAPLITSLPGLGAGQIGNTIPAVSTIAGITNSSVAESTFNYLTLAKSAGGKGNIATAPTALNVSLNLLLQTNKAKVIANPSVVAVDGTEALVDISQEVLHKVTSTVSLGVVTTNVELTKAGIFLSVLPRISEDGFITMRLRPQVSSPIGGPQTFGTTTVTLLSTREILSESVRVKDGQTLVLGGLFTEQEQAQLAKIPYLSETPVFGALFRNSLKGRNRTELLLLITPKVVEEEPNSISDSGPSPTM